MTTPSPTCQHCGKPESEHDSQRDNHIFTVAAGFEQPVSTQPSDDTSSTPRTDALRKQHDECGDEDAMGSWEYIALNAYATLERELTALATELAATKDKFYASETMRHKALADLAKLRADLLKQPPEALCYFCNKPKSVHGYHTLHSFVPAKPAPESSQPTGDAAEPPRGYVMADGSFRQHPQGKFIFYVDFQQALITAQATISQLTKERNEARQERARYRADAERAFAKADGFYKERDTALSQVVELTRQRDDVNTAWELAYKLLCERFDLQCTSLQAPGWAADKYDSLRTQLTTQARQLAAMREALLKYGIHAQECALQVYGETVCSCGLEAALAHDSGNDWVKRESQTKVGVMAVIRDEQGCILLGLKARAFDPEFVNKWVTPGGRVNFGEPLEAAIIREVKEETGLDVRVVASLPPQEIIHTKGHYVFFGFVVDPIGGTAISGDDLSGVQWFTKDEIMALDMTPITQRAISDAALTRAKTALAGGREG